jgi:hypothetical protein
VTLTNNGAGVLTVTGLQLGGADPGDFFIGSSTCGGQIASGSSCLVTVRFAPLGQGSRSATLLISGNDPASPAMVTLSGSGAPLPQGATGAQGPAGPQGPAGKIELVSCKTVTKTITKLVKHKRHKVRVTRQQCTARLLTGTVKFTATGVAAQASISRAGVVYANGTSVPTGSGSTQLVLNSLRRLRSGRYTLTLRSRQRRRWTTHRSTITIEQRVRNA